MTRKTLLLLLLCISCTSCCSADEILPGMTRQNGKVFLMENHCNSLIAWHSLGVTNAVVVHLDTHDDFRAVDSHKQDKLGSLLAAGDYKTVFENSDTSQFLNLKKRNTELLYDLGNFLYPCLKLGMVSRIYWVVPEHRIDQQQSARLQAILKKHLPVDDSRPHGYKGGGFTAQIHGGSLIVLTLDGLPELEAGALIDFDIDFFAFPMAMSESHLIGEVSRNPEEALAVLDRKVPSPNAVTVSASVSGGYTPLLERFLADSIFDYYSTGIYPQDGRTLLETLAAFRVENPDNMLSTKPESTTYEPAWRHMQGLRQLSQGQPDKAMHSMIRSAKQNPVYTKGLLDMAEASLAMKMTAQADRFIDSFETLNGGATYNSMAIRAMTLIEHGKHADALEISSRLVEWEANPYTQLIYGSALQNAGELEKAEEQFLQVLGSQPGNAAASFNLGLIHEARGANKEATQYFQGAIDINPRFWQAHEHLGHLLMEAGHLDAAVALLARAIQLNPFSVASGNNLGLCLKRQGKLDKAIAIFGKTRALNPDNITLSLNLAEALHENMQYDEAGIICAQVLAIDKSNKQALKLIQEINLSRKNKPK